MSSEMPEAYLQLHSKRPANGLDPEPIRNPHCPYTDHFGRYATLPEYSNRLEAITLLETLGTIVKSYMDFEGIKVPLLQEFPPNNSEEIRGLYDGLPYKPGRILIVLRSSTDPTQFEPLNYLLDTLCHELAHFSTTGSVHHDDRFWVTNKMIIEWVEKALDHRILIARDHPRLKRLQFSNYAYAPIVKALDVPQDLDAIRAVWDWEKKIYGWNADFIDVPDPITHFVEVSKICDPDRTGDGRGSKAKSG